MWTHEHAADTPLPPEAVWQALADLDNWAQWDTSMERVELHGPLKAGSTVTMTPKGQDRSRRQRALGARPPAGAKRRRRSARM